MPEVSANNASNLSQGGSGLAIPTDNVAISSAISQRSLEDTVLTMVNYFTGFLGFIATLALVYSGVLWIINGGNDEMISKAKKIITYALLGIILIILSQAIVRFVAFSGQSSGPAQGLFVVTLRVTPDNNVQLTKIILPFVVILRFCSPLQMVDRCQVGLFPALLQSRWLIQI